MNNIYSNVTCGGMDVHYKFSNVTFRDKNARVVRRERLNHPQRAQLQEHINHWPKDISIVLEASFGWGWLSDLLGEAGLEPHLSNCYKLEQMRLVLRSEATSQSSKGQRMGQDQQEGCGYG